MGLSPGDIRYIPTLFLSLPSYIFFSKEDSLSLFFSQKERSLLTPPNRTKVTMAICLWFRVVCVWVCMKEELEDRVRVCYHGHLEACRD